MNRSLMGIIFAGVMAALSVTSGIAGISSAAIAKGNPAATASAQHHVAPSIITCPGPFHFCDPA